VLYPAAEKSRKVYQNEADIFKKELYNECDIDHVFVYLSAYHVPVYIQSVVAGWNGQDFLCNFIYHVL
jgi:hypothetical protein